METNCKSIAFPLISSGIFGYPPSEALQIATDAIHDFLKNNEIDVYLIIYDKDVFSIAQKLLGEIDSYIDENYIQPNNSQRNITKRMSSSSQTVDNVFEIECEISDSLNYTKDCEENPFVSILTNLDEPFSNTLLRLIDSKGKNDVDVYKRANIDRKLFSKIRSTTGYMPSKRTALALAIALELTLSETQDLLERAGYALSHSQKFDVIIEYFIINKEYDIYKINEVLFHYDQALLGQI